MMRNAAGRFVVMGYADGPPARPVETSDTLALKAWLDRGMPEEEIVYDEDAPKMTPEQLAQFKPARFKVRK